jgi:hypothetical protein
MQAVRQANIPALLPSLKPKLSLHIGENRAAPGAGEDCCRSRALSSEKLLQGLDKFTVAPGAWEIHIPSSSNQIAER